MIEGMKISDADAGRNNGSDILGKPQMRASALISWGVPVMLIGKACNCAWEGRMGIIRSFIAVAGALFAPPNGASAQNYPDRPVRIIIAFSPAGAIDTLGRILAQKLSEAWGQQVVVENRPGAGGNIGAAAAAQSAPDGYTLHFGAQTLAVNVSLAPSTAFDPVNSFDPIMLVASSQEVFMVANNTPFQSIKDVVEYAKANPGKLNYASVGIGSSAHLATSLFSNLTGIKMQHVPYSQLSQAATDMISGRTEIWFTTLGGSMPHIQSGKVRVLAVSGPVRAKLLPNVPTLTELGVKMDEESSWYAMFAPKGTPKPIVDKVNRDLARILATPELKEREAALGYRFSGGPPEKLAAFLKSEIAKWADVTKSPGFAAK
jgi:tripartite-type tricarboxylate transporter receptor subunit TctC